jgi:hypothetical protein
LIQIFQFDQREVLRVLVAHLADNNHRVADEDADTAYLQEVTMDGTTEFINGQIQVVIGDNTDDEAI